MSQYTPGVYHVIEFDRLGRKLGAPDDADKARHYARKLAEILGE